LHVTPPLLANAAAQTQSPAQIPFAPCSIPGIPVSIRPDGRRRKPAERNVKAFERSGNSLDKTGHEPVRSAPRYTNRNAPASGNM
jgi:hypothetical protein